MAFIHKVISPSSIFIYQNCALIVLNIQQLESILA